VSGCSDAAAVCRRALGGVATRIGVQGVQFRHLEKQVGGFDQPRRNLLAPPVDDTKLSTFSLSAIT